MYQLKKLFLTFLLNIKKCLSKYSKKQNMKTTKGFKSENMKTSVNSAACLVINSKNDELRNDVERLAIKIVKKYYGDIDKTFKILNKQGIKVYRTKKAVKMLKRINERQGFLTELRGIKAIYLNFMIGVFCEKKLVFKNETSPMFVFSTSRVDTYYLASQIYRFVAYRKKMPGFEYEVQEKFKKIYCNPSVKNFDELTAGDIFAIKEAIARDVEAVDFAFKLHQENEISEKLSTLTKNINKNE